MNLQNTFYRQLNQSLNWDYKQTRWQSYREVLTHWLLEKLEATDDVLVVGAGYLNDLDLPNLIRATRSMSISDIDNDAMVYGLKRYGLSVNEVQLITKDYTGLSKQGFFDGLQQQLNEKAEVGVIIDFIKTNFNSDIEGFVKAYDSIIILPIYTQMFLPLFQSMMAEPNVIKYYTEGETSEITQIYLEQSAIMIEQFNKRVVEALQAKGKLFVIADIIELTDTLLKQANIMTDDQHKSDSKRLQTYVESYWDTYGLGFSGYGLHHLAREIQLDDMQYILWPYSDNRNMIVAYAQYTKQ